MSPTIDWKAEAEKGRVRTRDGRQVRIYATDHCGPWSMVGAVLRPDTGEWATCDWRLDGGVYTADESKRDLVLVPETSEYYLVLSRYKGTDHVHTFRHLDSAVRVSEQNPQAVLATKKLIITHGERDF